VFLLLCRQHSVLKVVGTTSSVYQQELVVNVGPFSEMDNEGVIEPDTDEPQEMGELSIEVTMFSIYPLVMHAVTQIY